PQLEKSTATTPNDASPPRIRGRPLRETCECAAHPATCVRLPALAERPRFDFERPRRRSLLRQPEADLRDVVRLDEERIRLGGHSLARTRQIDDAIHDDERDVDARRPES